MRLRAAKEDDKGRFGRIVDKVKRWATVFNEFMTVPCAPSYLTLQAPTILRARQTDARGMLSSSGCFLVFDRMWSALISIMIALIPPVQAQLATLRPIRSAIKSSGACSSTSFALSLTGGS